MPSSISSRILKSLFFINEDKGFIVRGNPSNGCIYTLLKALDGGNTWSIIYDNLGPMFSDIYFTDSNNHFIVGNRGTFCKTTDGGNSGTGDAYFDANYVEFSVNGFSEF